MTTLPELAKKVATTFIFRAAGALSALLLNAVIAINYTAEHAGLFFLAFTIFSFLMIAGRIGVDNVIIRQTSIACEDMDVDSSRNIYQFSLVWPGAILLTLSISLAVFSDYLATNVFQTPHLSEILIVFAPAIIFAGLFTINGQVLLGLQRANQSIIITNILCPIGCAALIFILNPTSIFYCSALFSIAAGLTLLVSFSFVPRSFFKFTKHDFKKHSYYWSTCIPLFWVSMSAQCVLWAGQLIAGHYTDPESIAFFTIAQRLAMLVSFSLLVCNSVFSPLLAKLHAQSDIKGLERLAKKSSVISLVISAPTLIVIYAFPTQLLEIFGKEYVGASQLLLILTIGQFINVSSGSVGQLLVMSGQERIYRNITLGTGLFAILCSFALVPQFGIAGAAWSTTLSMSAQNIVAACWVKKELGFWVIPLTKNDFWK